MGFPLPHCGPVCLAHAVHYVWLSGEMESPETGCGGHSSLSANYNHTASRLVDTQLAASKPNEDKTMLNTVIDSLSISQVRAALKANAQFMRHGDEYLKGETFREQVKAMTNELGWSVNQVIVHLLKINGCSA
jgi:hypothetical protein